MIAISGTNFFTIFYVLFSLGFVFQSREITAGLDPESFLSRWLKGPNSEDVQFIQHHIIKTSGTLIIHLTLPLIYLVIFTYISIMIDENHSSLEELIQTYPLFNHCFVLANLLLITALTLVFYWSLGNWQKHPFAKKLQRHCLTNSWRQVASDINNEFRRIDKFIIQTSPLNKVVLTENWIVQIGQWPWKFNLAHQSNVQLELVNSVFCDLSQDPGGVQYLTVKVKDQRLGQSFEIRLKSSDYRELENRVRGSITNAKNISIFKSVSDGFIEVFREHVEKNPKFQETEEVEPCIGCMAVPAEIKLIRRCQEQETPCENCYCRPMWCLTCLGKWFAMRQDQDRPETWLSSKCPCPTCRNKFCILDVSLLE